MDSKRGSILFYSMALCSILVLIILLSGCQTLEKATAIHLNFSKWYVVAQAEGTTLAEAEQKADSTAMADLAQELNTSVDEIKNPSIYIRYLSPAMKRRVKVGRRNVIETYYIARVELRAPKDDNPKS